MNDIKFTCPCCDQHLICDTEQMGSAVQCPSCSQIVAVAIPIRTFRRAATGKIALWASSGLVALLATGLTAMAVLKKPRLAAPNPVAAQPQESVSSGESTTAVEPNSPERSDRADSTEPGLAGFEIDPSVLVALGNDEIQIVDDKQMLPMVTLSAEDFASLLRNEPVPLASPAQFPNFIRPLAEGRCYVRISNPNNSAVRVALRSYPYGRDFYVPAHDTVTQHVPDGYYGILFIFADDPDSLYRGDNLTLRHSWAEITTTLTANGNYSLHRVN